MKPRELDELICEWSMRTGHGFRQHELDSLVDLISEATEAELEDLRAELTPINGDWEDTE
jgi:hypothetical protein